MTPRQPMFNACAGCSRPDCSPVARTIGALDGVAPDGEFRVFSLFYLEHDEFPDRLRCTVAGRNIAYLDPVSHVSRVRSAVLSFLTGATAEYAT